MRVGDRIMELGGEYQTGTIQEIVIDGGTPLFTIKFDQSGEVRDLPMTAFEAYEDNPHGVYVVMGDAYVPGNFDGMDRAPAVHQFWPVAVFDDKPSAVKYAAEITADPSLLPDKMGIASARYRVMDAKYYGMRVFKKDAGYFKPPARLKGSEIQEDTLYEAIFIHPDGSEDRAGKLVWSKGTDETGASFEYLVSIEDGGPVVSMGKDVQTILDCHVFEEVR